MWLLPTVMRAEEVIGPVMTIQFWSLVDLAGPLVGRSYEATAMENMTAVTQKFGHSMKAFIVLPLVSAYFIDLLNAVMTPYFLSRI